MQLSLKMGLGGSRARGAKGLDAIAILGARDGFAIDFTKNRMVVNDADNPANAFDGEPQTKLTVYGADPWVVDANGLNLSAVRNFAVAMATNAFPYDPTALHIYLRFRLNAADSFDVTDASKLAVGGWVQVSNESRKVAPLFGTSVVLEAPLTIIPIAGDDLAVDTFANISGWIRAVKAKGVARVAVIGCHYLNFASGGDTVNAEQSLRASVRVAQRAAAMAEGADYVDSYAYMRALILAGDVAQGDWAVWHQWATNTHLTPVGEAALADAIRAAIF